jgi:hypothetical protein
MAKKKVAAATMGRAELVAISTLVGPWGTIAEGAVIPRQPPEGTSDEDWRKTVMSWVNTKHAAVKGGGDDVGHWNEEDLGEDLLDGLPENPVEE